MYFDTHCHVQFQAFKNDRDFVVDENLRRGVIMNVVGTQTDTSRAAVALAEKHENMYATIGTHPIHLHSTHVDEEETSFQSREEGFDESIYSELVQSKKVIAVGECGLDLFHLPKDVPVEEVLEKQKKVFVSHINFAEKHQLPLVIHCREAHDELVTLLKSLGRKVEGTVHCYTSDWEHAEEYLQLGLHLGFTGVITFPPRKTAPEMQEKLLEVVRRMPLERIVVETDTPYLAPQAYRGQRSEPWMVEEVVKQIAELRGLSFDEAMNLTTENAKRLFKVESI